MAVPYSEAYGELLEVAAAELRAAAAATDNESLRRFLELRAEAFFYRRLLRVRHGVDGSRFGDRGRDRAV